MNEEINRETESLSQERGKERKLEVRNKQTK
jgi:hypothetical protein